MCAYGNQVWNGKSGTLTAKPASIVIITQNCWVSDMFAAAVIRSWMLKVQWPNCCGCAANHAV